MMWIGKCIRCTRALVWFNTWRIRRRISISGNGPPMRLTITHRCLRVWIWLRVSDWSNNTVNGMRLPQCKWSTKPREVREDSVNIARLGIDQIILKAIWRDSSSVWGKCRMISLPMGAKSVHKNQSMLMWSSNSESLHMLYLLCHFCTWSERWVVDVWWKLVKSWVPVS